MDGGGYRKKKHTDGWTTGCLEFFLFLIILKWDFLGACGGVGCGDSSI